MALFSNLARFGFVLTTHREWRLYTLTPDGHLSALRARSGSTIWHIALSMSNAPPSLFALGNAIYIWAYNGSVDAVSASSGSVLWHHQGGAEGTGLQTGTESAVFLASSAGANTFGSIVAYGPAMERASGTLLYLSMHCKSYRRWRRTWFCFPCEMEVSLLYVLRMALCAGTAL